jgi:hypothetical protein
MFIVLQSYCYKNETHKSHNDDIIMNDYCIMEHNTIDIIDNKHESNSPLELGTYVAMPGDTLNGVALMHAMTLQEIVCLNFRDGRSSSSTTWTADRDYPIYSGQASSMCPLHEQDLDESSCNAIKTFK